jgi:hypothetical protein
MTSWGFIGLAYGLAAAALVGYLCSLRGRLRAAGAARIALDGERRWTTP